MQFPLQIHAGGAHHHFWGRVPRIVHLLVTFSRYFFHLFTFFTFPNWSPEQKKNLCDYNVTHRQISLCAESRQQVARRKLKRWKGEQFLFIFFQQISRNTQRPINAVENHPFPLTYPRRRWPFSLLRLSAVDCSPFSCFSEKKMRALCPLQDL